jgi:integrative and conjugative element protein (TIGR02256 family)
VTLPAGLTLLGYVPLDAERGDVVPGSDGRSLGPEVMAALRRHRHPGLDVGTEAGGILLGRYIVDSQGIVADEVTEPAAGDVREPRAFHRLDDLHARTVVERWRESDGCVHYVGEWHTHAEPRPTPSWIDLDAWTGTMRDDAEVRGAGPILFVIVGQSEIGVWEGWLR